MLDDLNLDYPEDSPPPPRPGGRRFVVAAGILGAIMLLALAAIAVYALVILPGQQTSPPVDEVAAQMTGTALAELLQVTDTATPTVTDTPTLTATFTPSSTPTDANTATPITPVFTIAPATQTVQALLTQAALAQTQAASGTQVFGTPTATQSVNILPDSGFGDNANLPGLLLASVLLVVVILGARRLRTSA